MSWVDSCDLEYALADLKAENASLKGAAQGLGELCDQLKIENANLREQNRYLMKGDLLHVLTDQEFAEQQKREREMQASIKALDDENAKLREENQHIGLVAYELGRNSLAQENSALRELVRELYQCSRQVGCDHCGDGYRRSCSVLDLMRELGVEV